VPTGTFRGHRRTPTSSTPVESACSLLKRSLANLANVANRDIAQLTTLVKTRLRRMQHQPGLIEGFLAEPGSTSRPSVTQKLKIVS
jgi:hypothetical protein